MFQLLCDFRKWLKCTKKEIQPDLRSVVDCMLEQHLCQSLGFCFCFACRVAPSTPQTHQNPAPHAYRPFLFQRHNYITALARGKLESANTNQHRFGYIKSTGSNLKFYFLPDKKQTTSVDERNKQMDWTKKR